MGLDSSNIVFSAYPARWYMDLMDNLPIGVFRSTLEGRILFCNKTFANIFGFDSRKELKNLKVINLYEPTDHKGDFVKAIIARGHVEGLHLPFRKKDGTSIWCAITAEAVFDDEGVDVFLDGVVRDITKKILDQETSVRLGDMAIAVKDFIVILDVKGILLDINKVGADLLGMDREGLMGEPLLDYIVPRFRELFRLFIFDTLKTGREEGLLTVMDKDGHERHLEFHAFLVKKKGKPQHIKGIGRDVTGRMRQQREQLSKEKFRGVLEMAGGVAHSLNQPLTIVNNLLNEILSDLPSNNPHSQKIRKIYDQVKKLNDLSTKIRRIKKYEAVDYVHGIKIVDLDKVT